MTWKKTTRESIDSISFKIMWMFHKIYDCSIFRRYFLHIKFFYLASLYKTLLPSISKYNVTDERTLTIRSKLGQISPSCLYCESGDLSDFIKVFETLLGGEHSEKV